MQLTVPTTISFRCITYWPIIFICLGISKFFINIWRYAICLVREKSIDRSQLWRTLILRYGSGETICSVPGGEKISFSPCWGEAYRSVPDGEKTYVQSQLRRSLSFSHCWGEAYCSVPDGEKPFVQSHLRRSLSFSPRWRETLSWVWVEYVLKLIKNLFGRIVINL